MGNKTKVDAMNLLAPINRGLFTHGTSKEFLLEVQKILGELSTAIDRHIEIIDIVNDVYDKHEKSKQLKEYAVKHGIEMISVGISKGPRPDYKNFILKWSDKDKEK